MARQLLTFGILPSLALSTVLTPRQDCSANFKICSPPGATKNTLGSIGPGWDSLYNDIINVVNGYSIDDAPVTTSVDPNGPARRDMAFCCSDVANCLLVQDYGIPMCWDRFTTNVYFPDGTYGTVVSGDFNTSDGSNINLVYGDYTLKNGQKGNIYSDGPSSTSKPETSTMSMPRPFTSSGEGSAIPATGLGTMGTLSTGTTVVPATTIAATTSESITLIATMTGCNNCPPWDTTIAGGTQSATTLPASTAVFTTAALLNSSNTIITPTMPASGRAAAIGTEMYMSFAAAMSVAVVAICL